MTHLSLHDACRWYVVHTKPKQESRAESNLRVAGLEILLPRLREPRSGKALLDRVAYSEGPLFPGYLFARFDAARHLTMVRLTRGVHSIVGFGEYATPIQDSLVDLIRGRIEADGFVHLAEPKPGDGIEVVSGPLRELDGVFERTARGRDRVFILLNRVGAIARVEIPKAFIRKTDRIAVT
jgi:transcriptional antiterminator RfaH